MAGILLSFLSFLSPLFSDSVRIVIAGVILSTVLAFLIYSYRFASSVGITCVPKEESNTAKEQHHGEYRVKDGHTKFNTYVCIPEWQSEPEVEISLSDSFEIAAWNYPDDVEFNESYTKFEGSRRDNFSFDLELDGKEEELYGGDFTIEFVDKMTDNTVQKIVLDPI
ncbi:hypothetical protein NP511_07655 [Natrinema thermotolerans]|uniref:Uncharacterized protein n=1 Tax=Natrinema thermotolerans TaxID=121872 RepID=A0AAF0PE59_9EURY|nr:hypothetical protein [Natrinema thermotolerans]WMT09505.1 hypothetical protein NP511_07655 [Natrinema thermotolerans]